MGILTNGAALSWEETKKYAQHIRKHGINQFINLYNRLKDREGDPHKWGDEIEYMLVQFFDDKKQVKIDLRGPEMLSRLEEKKKKDPTSMHAIWEPEYCSFMLEASPVKPYDGLLTDFNLVEANFRNRRKEVQAQLNPGEVLLSCTAFPRLGCEDFTYPPTKPTPDTGLSQSLFLPDDIIHPASVIFPIVTVNARSRRGEPVAINVPIYKDKNTVIPVDDSYKHRKSALPDHVYMDALGFGMGCCSLQTTFQAYNLAEARTLYDQLAPWCPIMLALTAASPIHRGFVTDVDCRWNIIVNSIDCRTEEERGLTPLKENKFVIKKSRYDTLSSYLSPEGEQYNDISYPYHEEDYKKLIDNGIDPLMAGHIANMFTRETIYLLEDDVKKVDDNATDYFENILLTVWPSLRFKHPIPDQNCGWRVEFRTCELQMTDFENAAITCFLVLLSRVILTGQMNFLMPISKIDENVQNAIKRDAINNQKFWFRKNITTPSKESKDDTFVQLTINEVFNGKEGQFSGIISIINKYLSTMEADINTLSTIQKYLTFIQRRASGEILTTAGWIRKFVTEHPSYRQDSVVSDQINYDLMKTIKDIQYGQNYCPLLQGPK